MTNLYQTEQHNATKTHFRYGFHSQFLFPAFCISYTLFEVGIFLWFRHWI